MTQRENQSKSIALIGLSGTGKSTLGPLLARELRVQFVDTDREIEHAAAKPIHRIFSDEGEAEFRRLETEAIKRALASNPVVVSVGGGAVISERNREMLWQCCIVIWLHAEADEIIRRLTSQKGREQRPLLGGQGPEERLREMLIHRRQYYEMGHIHIDCTRLSPEEVAEIALSRIEAYRSTTAR